MNSFGLGLMLNFVDNASAGMNTATANMRAMSNMADQVTGSFNVTSQSVASMAIVGATMSQLGNTFTQMGAGILSTIGNVVQGMTQMGTELLGTRMTLSTLYGGAEAGAKKFAEAQQYAVDSVFELKDILPAITIMKAVGIEAMNDVTTSTGKTTQKLMDYASDIAAMFPNMRNAYGTGVQAAMGALKEYIAEGNALSLKRGAGLDITGLLGEAKGKTIEERTRQIADLVEVMGIAGMTASLLGTPSQQISRMSDSLYNAMIKIVDGGVFEAYGRIINIFAEAVDKLEQSGDLAILAQIVSDAIVQLMIPLEKLAYKIVDAVNAFVAFTKEHPKLAKTIIQVTALAGVLLLTSGIALKLGGSLLVLIASFKMLNVFTNGQFAITRSLASAFGGLFSTIVPLIALIIVLKQIWQRNMFGIRDFVKTTGRDLLTTFSLIKDAWDDNTLSDENFKKANELGVLPLISSLLDLKYNLSDFVTGFKTGFESVFGYLDRLTQKFKPIHTTIRDMSDRMAQFVRDFTGLEVSSNWQSAGQIFGQIAAALIIIVPLIKVLGVLWTVVKPIISVIKFVVSAISTIVGAIPTIIGGISTAIGAIATFFTTTAGIITGIVGAVIAIGVLIFVFRKQIADFFIMIGTTISNVFTATRDNVVGFMASIIEALGIAPILKAILRIFNTIGGIIASFISNVISVVSAIINTIVTIIKGIFKVIKAVIDFIVTFVKVVVDIIAGIFRVVYEAISIVILSIMLVFKKVFGWIKDRIIDPVVTWIVNRWNELVSFLTPVIEGIASVFETVAEKIKTAFSTVKDFFVGIFDAISEKATQVFDWIADKIKVVTDFFSGIGSWVSGGLSKAGDFLGGIKDNLANMVGLSTGGYVKTTGIAMLHPNEVVVNDSLTQGLKNIVEKDRRGVNTVLNNPVTTSTSSSDDYSITVEKGAIQIVVEKATTDTRELEAMADKFMKIVERKMQLKQMSRNNKPKSKVVFAQ